jgi:hypothetical protein
VALSLGSERLGTDSVAAAERRGCIARWCSAETMAGTGPGRIESGWMEGREEGRSGSLGLGFGLVAMGLGSLIVGRRGYWR